MKIVVTASTFPRWENDSVPTFVQEQLTCLKKLHPDWDIKVLAPHDEGAKAFEIAEFGEIHRFRYLFPARYQRLVYPAILPNLRKNKWLYFQVPFLLLSEFCALLRLVIRSKPDFIYSHWFVPQGVVGGLVGLITGVSHVYTSHSSDILIARKIPILGPLVVRFITRKSKRVTVVSKRSFEKLKGFFSDEKWTAVSHKVKIIPMGVDTGLFSSRTVANAEWKSKYGYEGRNVILFIGRLAEKKGVKYLLDAISEYKKIDPDVLLVIGGDGPLRAELSRQVSELTIEKYVDFVGYVSGVEKLELFGLCDVLILPSIIADDGDAEGMPVVLMEGLAAGKLCIATDVSGADDVLENRSNGFLIRPKNSDDIVNTLLEIQNMDRAMRQQISDRARARSQQLDWVPIVERHVQHLFQD